MRLPLSLATTISLLSIQAVEAHGIWTEKRYGQLEVIYGHGAEDDPYAAEKIKEVWAYDLKGKTIPVTVQRESDHARLSPLSKPAVLTVTLDNGVWSQTKDGKSVDASKAEVPGAISTSHSFKYSLAILQPHADIPANLRLRMVIRPLRDPTEVGVGHSLPVEVTIDGKPIADLALFDDYRGMPDATPVKTDARGRATVTVRNAGLNVIAAQAKLPNEGENQVSQTSLSTTLTFVGEAHQH
ncbi:DUF4198 domain-containing protein [Pseudomonas sp. S31]|uniref:DUF4198 domain-containing protein n=1 Tax=Pseudomonas sp. S31 TaxID=1564473 RepID=UPI0019131749|nr:DUF4198 domain-containing protein [Pseudomonas sp. S31]MBK4998928.1 DUF4198 domain-containing protein [Pseudomonas sp. S31]